RANADARNRLPVVALSGPTGPTGTCDPLCARAARLVPRGAGHPCPVLPDTMHAFGTARNAPLSIARRRPTTLMATGPISSRAYFASRRRRRWSAGGHVAYFDWPHRPEVPQDAQHSQN